MGKQKREKFLQSRASLKEYKKHSDIINGLEELIW